MVEGADARTRGWSFAPGRRERRFVTPKHIPYSQHRFPHIERLDDVIVRAMLKPDDPVDFTVHPSDHNERHIANCPHLPRQLQPVSVTELQVEGHEIDVRLAEQIERLMFRGRFQNGKSF